MKNQDLNILDEVNKGATMGMDAISFVSEKIDNDDDFKNVLDTEYTKYQKISQRVNDLYCQYTDKEPHETNAMNKAMTWYGIQIRTMTDSSASKLAELLLQGLNMGVIEGRRLLNQKDGDSKVLNLVNEYVNMQEKYVEEMKEFL